MKCLLSAYLESFLWVVLASSHFCLYVICYLDNSLLIVCCIVSIYDKCFLSIFVTENAIPHLEQYNRIGKGIVLMSLWNSKHNTWIHYVKDTVWRRREKRGFALFTALLTSGTMHSSQQVKVCLCHCLSPWKEIKLQLQELHS